MDSTKSYILKYLKLIFQPKTTFWRRYISPNEIEIREFRFKGVYNLKLDGDSVKTKKKSLIIEEVMCKVRENFKT